MTKTKIEWTEKTWNPIAGCSKISDGCKNCYAIPTAHRLAGNPIKKIADKYKGVTKAENGKINWTGHINLDEEVLLQPLKRKKPTMYFVNSMSDIFHENVKDEWIDKLFAVMSLCPQHTFQVLTKRAERMREYVTRIYDEPYASFTMKLGEFIYFLGDHPTEIEIDNTMRQINTWATNRFHNVWLIVSAEDQKTADERIPLLLDTPASVRGVSAEPLLGEINFKLHSNEINTSYNSLNGEFSANNEKGSSLDWVIVGGESGNKARSCNISDIRQIVIQCKSAKVPVFVKQLGVNPFEWIETSSPSVKKILTQTRLKLKDKKGGNINEFPKDLQIREFPRDRS